MPDTDPRDKRIAELEAQVRSLIAGKEFIGYAKRDEQPDDTPFDEEFAENESFGEDVFTLASKYDVPVTNNAERWVNGQYLRHIGEFHHDIERMCQRWLVPEAVLAVKDGSIELETISQWVKDLEEAEILSEIRMWESGLINEMRSGRFTDEFLVDALKNLERLLYPGISDEFLDSTTFIERPVDSPEET
jgi:hypothetical protein